MEDFDYIKYLKNNLLLNENNLVNTPESESNQQFESLKTRIKNIVKEMSVSGGGAAGASFAPGIGDQYSTPNTFNPNKKAKGTAHNYLTDKMGYKLVDRKKQAKLSRAIDYKDLWGSTYKN
jgi:hypothetical protein